MDMGNDKKGVIVVISGPSGSGESTITQALLDRLPAKRLVTATTRAPRVGEEDGKDYFFFSKERFLREIEDGNIVEYTHIKNRDTYYGGYRPEVEGRIAAGDIVIANTDIVGTRYYKNQYDAVTIFVAPESLDALAKRIRGRNPEIPEEELDNRIENARHEIEEEQPFYDYTIENLDGRLEDAVERAERIIRARLPDAKSS